MQNPKINVHSINNKRTIRMQKRCKWTEKDDGILKQSVTLNLSELTKKKFWESISISIQEQGVLKNPKQCHQRWKYYLSPALSEEKWNTEDTIKLFELHKVYGSKWSKIALKFDTRSPMFIKNKFFLSLRKCIRNLLKYTHTLISSTDLKTLQSSSLLKFLEIQLELTDSQSKTHLKMINFILTFIEGGLELLDKSYPWSWRDQLGSMFLQLIKNNQKYIDLRKTIKTRNSKNLQHWQSMDNNNTKELNSICSYDTSIPLTSVDTPSTEIPMPRNKENSFSFINVDLNKDELITNVVENYLKAISILSNDRKEITDEQMIKILEDQLNSNLQAINMIQTNFYDKIFPKA